MLIAVHNGNGSMAQFNHPDFGGCGQWMQGGMTMVSDLFNNQLKYRVDSVCNDIANELAAQLAEELMLDTLGAGLLMLYLGRYDYIPTDTAAQQRVREYLQSTETVSEQDIVALFDRWHPWGGLAYWLWDWSKVPTAAPG